MTEKWSPDGEGVYMDTNIKYKRPNIPAKWRMHWRKRSKWERTHFITFGFVIDIQPERQYAWTATPFAAHTNIEIHIPFLGYLQIEKGVW